MLTRAEPKDPKNGNSKKTLGSAAYLGAMLAHLGAMWAHLGGYVWAHLGAMLAHLGAMLAHLDAYVGPS